MQDPARDETELSRFLDSGRHGGRNAGDSIHRSWNSSPVDWHLDAPIEVSAAVLELTASELPEMLEIVAHMLATGTMSFTIHRLVAAFEVPPAQIAETAWRACADLDHLEKQRGPWRDPAKFLNAPNLAALLYMCQARLNRVPQLARRRRLERILKRVEGTYRHSQARAWIEDFIGEP